MWRTFRLQAMTGAAQPLFGDKLTAAMAIPPSGVDPIVTVADTTIYEQGDRIQIDAGQANMDTVLIIAINSATQMQVSSQGAPYHAHALNAIIALDIPASNVKVVPISSNKASIYIGSDNTVTSSGGGNVIDLAIYGTPWQMAQSSNWNTVRTSDAWMAGSLSDSAIVSAQVI